MQQRNRYPGIKPFSKEDHPLFQGRDKEINDLFYLVKAKRLAVLFGKSGIGKTSLLQAGVFHLFEKDNIIPLIVRFQNTDSSPLNIIVKHLEPFVNKDLLKEHTDYMSEATTLWQYVKACEFEKKGKTLLLVFDQFEEYFIHQKNERKPCTRQIADLINDRLPDNIQRQLRKIPRKERTEGQLDWYQPLDTKILFLIRSDKLSLMDEMTEDLSAILKARYNLLPLQKEEAAKAITNPAKLDDTEYTTLPFSYEPETVKQILEALGNKEGEVECFQLQVLCQHIEREVKLRQGKGQKGIVVSPTYLGGKKGIENILNNYYENQIKLIPDKKNQGKARKLIEEGLIIDGRRIGVDEAFLIKNFEIDQNLLLQLLSSRLLQVENTRFGKSYEVSHDSLVSPILQSYKKRQLEEANNRLAWRFGIVAICLFAIALIAALTAAYQIYENGRLRHDYTKFKEKTTNIWVKEGEKNQDIGDDKSALENYSNALEFAQDSLAIYQKISKLDQKQIFENLSIEDEPKEKFAKTLKDLETSYWHEASSGNPEYFDKIEESYSFLIEMDSTNYEAQFGYANYLFFQNHLVEALIHYNKAGQLAQTEKQKVQNYNAAAETSLSLEKWRNTKLLLHQSSYTNNEMNEEYPLGTMERQRLWGDLTVNSISPSLSLQHYEAAQEALLNYPLPHPTSIQLSSIKLHNTLGQYWQSQNDYLKANEFYDLALEKSKSLKTNNKLTPIYWEAMTLYNLGTMYQRRLEKQKAKQYYDKAINLFATIAKQNPDAYNFALSRVLVEATNVLRPISDTDKQQHDSRLLRAKKLLEVYEGRNLPFVKKLNELINYKLKKEKKEK